MTRTSTNKGIVLALTFIFIPLALIMAITVAHSITFGAGYSLRAQQEAKVFYIAEAGINIAYRLFQSGNFSTDTHKSDGTVRVEDDPELLVDGSDDFNLSRDHEGWYTWRWEPGNPREDSFTQSGVEESFRFQVRRPTAASFQIVCEARMGRLNETHVLEGKISSMLDYVLYDNGDFADFTGSYDQYVTGDIHANGDIYLRPFETKGLLTAFAAADNPRLTLTVNSLTSGGRIIRHKDPWGHEDDGGTVQVVNARTGASALMEGVSQGVSYSGQGNAYDSYHPDWSGSKADPASAHSRWDGAVADRSMGAQTQSSAIVETFEPGGFFSKQASVKIDSSTSAPWVSDVSFYNESEERLVTVKEIDLAAMSAAGEWPDNGLIYSEEPIRIINGQELASDITISGASTIYIKGDFNKKYPTEADAVAGLSTHKKASIVTPDRIYQLTSSFEDKPASNPDSLLDLLAGVNKATDSPLHALDPDDTLEMNGAFVDGVPTTDARSWINDPDNPYYVEDDGVLGFDRKVKQVSFSGMVLKVSYAQSESLLENMQEVRIVGSGCYGHMRNANMAHFDNSNASKTVVPWLEHTYYVPPKQIIDGKPGKEFEYDPSLSAIPGGKAMPFSLKLGRRERWYRK